MAVEKTQAIVLKVSPFRESSCILYLLTREQGLVHGVARGVKRKKTGMPSLERGFLTELVLYTRPNRDLHSVGALSVLKYYPSIRTDLLKNVVRDIAFEVLLKTMSCDSPHPEVFSCLAGLCDRMETTPAGECFPLMAWRFFYDFSRLMGVAPDLETCATCGRPVAEASGAFLLLESGSMTCGECKSIGVVGTATFLPRAVLQSLSTGRTNNVGGFSPGEIRRITRLFARYCQYHFHHDSDFKSIKFMDSILETAPEAENEYNPGDY